MLSTLPSNKIAQKLIKALVVFSAFITVGITGAQLWMEYGRDVRAIDARFVQVERSYLGSVADTVWQADDIALDLQLQGIIEFPDFRFAGVRDENGDAVMSVGQADGDNLLQKSYPLHYTFRGEQRLVGTLDVAASLDGVYERLWERVGFILFFNALKTTLVAMFLFALVYWLMTRHLETMAKYVRGLDFDQPAPDLAIARGRLYGGPDELDVLSRALNDMKDNLYASYENVSQLSDELEVRVRGRTRALSEEVAKHKKTAEKLAQNEARLKDVVESGSDWTWEMGPDLRFTYHSVEHSTGDDFASADVVGRARTDFALDLDETDKWANHMEDLENRRSFRDFVYRRKTPDGTESYVRISGKPVFDDDGEFLGYRGVSTNVTAEVLAEKRAREAREQLRVLSSAIEQNPSAVFITDHLGAIQFVNDKFEELTGYRLDEIKGKNPRVLKSEQTPRAVHKDIWDTITQGKSWRGELQDRRKDGATFWAYATIAPVKNNNGDITHYVATHEDITVRKENERRLREATERAEVANRTKSEIMANMSHELRTPLNAIIGFSDTILSGVFGDLNNERYEDYITDIKESGTHLLALINDILDVSAIEAGKLELRLEPEDVEPLVTSSIKLVSHRAEGAKVRLDTQLDDDIPSLMVDGRRMKQVLLNVLSNAVKFTPEGGRVTLRALIAPEGGVRFEVEDTGIGMDDAGIETALTQFGQVDSKLARKYEGTGLGLPLTKSLVELHGGTLEVRSRLGHGTTVCVQLPPECSIPEGGEGTRPSAVAKDALESGEASKTVH